MGQRGVEKHALAADLAPQRIVAGVAYAAHEAHAVGNHDEDHAHVLRKGEQEVAEVLRLDDGRLAVELPDALQPVHDAGYGFAEVRRHTFVALNGGRTQHDGHQTVAPESYLVGGLQRRIQAAQDGIEAEGIPLKTTLGMSLAEALANLRSVTVVERNPCMQQFAVARDELPALRWG